MTPGGEGSFRLACILLAVAVGKTLATGSGDGTVKFWEAAWKEEE